MINRSRIIYIAVLISITFLPSLSLSAVTMRYKLIWILNEQYAGELYAYHKGWYEKEGLNIKFIPYGDGRDPYSAVVSGKTDIGVSSSISMLRSATKDNSDIVIFAIKDQISPAGFLSLSRKNIVKPSDLEGKTFGYYHLSNHALLKWFCEKYSVDHKGIKMVKVRPNDMDPLLDGTVDFIIAHETNEPIILKLTGHDTRFMSLSDARGIHHGAIFLCKRDYYERHQQEISKFVEVTARGWQAAISHPEEAADIILKSLPRSAYVDKSRELTKRKIIKSIGIKSFYITYKVGGGCIGCMSRVYWDVVADQLMDEGVISQRSELHKLVRYDAIKGLNKDEVLNAH